MPGRYHYTEQMKKTARERSGRNIHKKIRTTLIAARDSAIKNTETILKNIVTGYQNSRKQKLDSTRKSCKDNSLKKKCISLVCNTNMTHKCDAGYEYEETLAGQLCKFYDTACERVK